MTQPNLFDTLPKLPGISIQTGDVRFPDVRPSATMSCVGESTESPISDPIGPPRQTANASLNDTGRRMAVAAARRARSKTVTNLRNDTGGTTAVAAPPPRRHEQQHKGEQIQASDGVHDIVLPMANSSWSHFFRGGPPLASQVGVADCPRHSAAAGAGSLYPEDVKSKPTACSLSRVAHVPEPPSEERPRRLNAKDRPIPGHRAQPAVEINQCSVLAP
jgi:hypothetical protein